MAFLIGGANSAADTGYNVDNSCRFNSADSAELTKTPGGAGNLDAWTLSFWFKRSNISGAGATSYQALYGVYADANNQEILAIQNDDKMYWQLYQSGSVVGQLTTTRVFRDVGAWYNVVISYDSANGTAGNRMRMWINGTEETSFSTDTNPSSGLDSQWNGTTKHQIGMITTTNKFDGYMAEIVSLDGTAVTDATNFGEFDSGSPTIWKPKDVSGLTFGTNGFYLDFEDSSNLGNDANGGTDFTEVNIAAADQSIDTPTNNFATFSPLFKNTFTFSEGNCVVNADTSDAHQLILSTIAPANGVWYAEFKITDLGGDYSQIGIRDVDQFVTAQYVGQGTRGYGYAEHGTVAASGSNVATSQTSYTTNDIIGVWMDLDNQVVKWYINDTLEYTYSSVTAAYNYAFAVSQYGTTSGQWEGNFGGCSGFTVSSGNADPNGFGNFEYATKSGYALCTKNLAEFGG